MDKFIFGKRNARIGLYFFFLALFDKVSTLYFMARFKSIRMTFDTKLIQRISKISEKSDFILPKSLKSVPYYEKDKFNPSGYENVKIR